MILMKIYIDIPQGAQDFFPDEYMPSDMIKFSLSDMVNTEKFINDVCEFLKGACNECKEKSEKKKRSEDFPKSSRFCKKNKY